MVSPKFHVPETEMLGTRGGPSHDMIWVGHPDEGLGTGCSFLRFGMVIDEEKVEAEKASIIGMHNEASGREYHEICNLSDDGDGRSGRCGYGFACSCCQYQVVPRRF
jgi:hypothetical protein